MDVSMIRVPRIRVVAVAVVAMVALGTAPATARPSAEVLLDGLSSPKPLTIGPNGNPVVGQGTFGPPGAIFEYVLRGPDRGDTVTILDDTSTVDIAFTPDGAGWAIGSDAKLYRMMPGGSPQVVLDIAAYQQHDPDPVDQDDFPEETNPYGLAALPSNDVLFSDAANNDLVRVTSAGDAWTVARFDLERISTDHLGGDFPPFLTAESVPTSVAIGPDGSAYVGELKGFPFRPGSSHVWRVSPNDQGAWCSVRTPEADCTVYAGGFTAIHDIAFNRANGSLYVYELAADGVLAYEEGFASGDFPPAVLLKMHGHQRTELAAGELSQPGDVAVAHDGTVFVTDGMFTGGRLLRIRG
jgi:hypothetical protein